MGQRPGSSRPLFDHSNASLRARPKATDLSTLRPQRAAWRSSSGSWPRGPRWKQRIGTAGEPRSSGRGPKAAETAPTGSKGSHSESRGSGETCHGAGWVIYIVGKNKSPRYLNRKREKNWTWHSTWVSLFLKVYGVLAVLGSLWHPNSRCCAAEALCL